MSVAVPTDVNKLSFSAHFAWDLAACTSFSLSWSCTGPAPRKLLCRQIADLPFQAVGRESDESPQNVALDSPRSNQASAWAGPPTKPWFDHVYYHAPEDSTEPQLGLARLLVRAVSGVRREVLVVQRLELAEYRPSCVQSRFNCRRYKWVMDPMTGFPALALVPLSRAVRLENVVPDFEELGKRWGLLGTPTTTPETPHERRRELFFTNVVFPWTTNSITDAP